MAILINLGVTEMPYSYGNLGKSKSGKERASTTGDVAAILEDKYHIMAFFWNNHQDEIIEKLSEGIQGAFETLLMGGPVTYSSALAAGASEVELLFQKMLDSKEMDYKQPGIPTQASLLGISHRFKKKKSKNKKRKLTIRPSFIDTGLYENSFRCWGGEE